MRPIPLLPACCCLLAIIGCGAPTATDPAEENVADASTKADSPAEANDSHDSAAPETDSPSSSKRGRGANDPEATALPQGIRGQVVRLQGSFLPGVPEEGGRIEPLSVPVHVFRGRVEPFEKPDPEHPSLVTIVRADAEGRFELSLPAGEYTVVADLGETLYLNNRLDDGNWATVTVKPNQWRNYTIEDVTEADF